MAVKTSAVVTIEMGSILFTIGSLSVNELLVMTRVITSAVAIHKSDRLYAF
jgi:hypothetical protein